MSIMERTLFFKSPSCPLQRPDVCIKIVVCTGCMDYFNPKVVRARILNHYPQLVPDFEQHGAEVD